MYLIPYMPLVTPKSKHMHVGYITCYVSISVFAGWHGVLKHLLLQCYCILQKLHLKQYYRIIIPLTPSSPQWRQAAINCKHKSTWKYSAKQQTKARIKVCHMCSKKLVSLKSCQNGEKIKRCTKKVSYKNTLQLGIPQAFQPHILPNVLCGWWSL